MEFNLILQLNTADSENLQRAQQIKKGSDNLKELDEFTSDWHEILFSLKNTFTQQVKSTHQQLGKKWAARITVHHQV